MTIKTISGDFNHYNKKLNNNKYNKKHNNKYNNNNNNNNNNRTNYLCNCDNYKPSVYNIQIGERNFTLSSESLNRDAPNFFTAAFFGYFSEAKMTNIFIERDPVYFSMIVRYLRGYEVDWPVNEKISMNNLLADVKFYGFERLQNLLEEVYKKNFPDKIIPWKILTYASESDPIVAINIKDVELVRWNSDSLIYDTSPALNKADANENGVTNNNNNIENVNDNDQDNDQNNNQNNDQNNNQNNDQNNNQNNNQNNDQNNNQNNDQDNNQNNDQNNNQNNDQGNNQNNDQDNQNNEQNNIIKPNPDKGLFRLEIHGRNAIATVNSNLNNGIKFENFTLKNTAEEKIFHSLTESFRTPEGSLNLTPSLKLPFLNDACVEIDGSRYYSYKDLSTYFGVNTKGKKLYFEEIVIRIDDGAFLIRARAWTMPFYYASQPFVHSVQSRKS